MSLQYTEGLDTSAGQSDLFRKWIGNGISAFLPNAAPWGSNAIRFTNTQNALWQYIWPSGKFSVTIYIGCWVRISAKPSANTLLFGLLTIFIGWGGGIGINTSGQTTAYQGQSSVVTTGTRNVCDGNWHWIEFAFTLPAAGATGNLLFDWYIDSTHETSTSSGNMAAFNVNYCGGGIGFWGMTGATMNVDYAGIVVWDNVGGFPNASAYPMGPQQINTLHPAGDSAVQFTPKGGTGTNYSQVSETIADDDTSYVQGLVGSGLQDLYNYQPLGFSPQHINGVMVNSRVKNPNTTGQSTYNVIGKSGATQRTPTAFISPGNNYQTIVQEYGVDPNTSAAWTPANLGNATFGIRAP